MKKLLSILVVMILAITTLVACFGPTDDLVEAQTYLKNLYKDKAEITPADFDVVAKCIIGDATFDVTWASSSDKVTIKESAEAGFWTVDVDERSTEDVAYTLTATIKNANGNTITYARDYKVPTFKVMTYAEYAETADDKAVVVKGLVSGICSKADGDAANIIYLQDLNGEGGYYVYSLEKDPVAELGIQIGMTVLATGIKDTYNGLYEVVKPNVEILDATPAAVTPVDFTEIYKNAEALTDKALSSKQSLLVTVKGVELKYEENTNGYYHFQLGNLKSYVRISSSNNCIPTTEIDAYKALHTEKVGYVADVTGILQLYNGAFYIIPTDACETLANIQLPPRTDAEKVELEMNNIKVGANYSTDTTVTLPLAGSVYSEVGMNWTSDNENAVVGADGKLTITVPEADTTVHLVVTVTCNNEIKTKTFVLNLSRKPITVSEALEVAEGETVFVTGTVKSIDDPWSDQFDNITVTITDGTKDLKIFRMKTNVVVGDVIQLKGTMSSYNGVKQIAKDAVAEITDPAPVEVTIPEAIALEDGRRVVVRGTVKTIDTPYSEDHDNITVTIEDAEGNTLYIYRLNGNWNVGDTIIITGKMATYNEKRQIAAKANAELVTPPAGGDNDDPATPPVGDDTKTEWTIPECLAAEDGTEVVVKGLVIKVSEWNTQYNNMNVTIKDEAGNELYLFRLYTKVTVGDQITVTGKVGSYNDEKQIAEGATAVITGHVEPDAPAAGTVSISFSDKANRTELSTEKQVWVQNGITVTNAKTAEASDIVDYAAPARFYKHSELTVACEGMTKITFNCNSGKYATSLGNSLTAAGITNTVSGSVVTVEVAAGTNSITVKLSDGQVRVDSIDVIKG